MTLENRRRKVALDDGGLSDERRKLLKIVTNYILRHVER
jgi:hypothetical protein